MQEGKRVDVRYHHISKTLDMLSLNILVPKLGHYSLDGLTKGWVTHWWEDEAEGTTGKGSYPSVWV